MDSIVREELYRVPLKKSCLTVFLCGVICGSDDLFSCDDGSYLFVHEDEEWMNFLSDVFFRLTNVAPSVEETCEHEKKQYVLRIEKNVFEELSEKCRFLKEVDETSDNDFWSLFGKGRDEKDRKRSFLRGMYLAGGSLHSPDEKKVKVAHKKSGYKLNVNMVSDRLRENVISIVMEEADVDRVSLLTREHRYGFFIKNSQAICNFLVAIGSSSGVLKLYELMATRKVKSDLNRMQNFEMANMDKTALSSAKQIAAITTLQRTIGLENLPEPLRVVCLLRLEYAEAPLETIAKKISPPMTKSGVNHRMRKIMELASERKKEENTDA